MIILILKYFNKKFYIKIKINKLKYIINILNKIDKNIKN